MITSVDRPAPRELLPPASPLRLTGEFVEFSADGSAVRMMSRDARGVASIWELPLGGGDPRKLLRFDDPARPVLRPYFTVQGEALYVVVQEQQSALWAMDVLHD